MPLTIGTQAPDFSLEGTDGTADGHRTYRLSDYRGRPVVLVFYPEDHTPVCTAQLNSYTSDIGEFAGVGAQVLAISPQSVQTHDTFAAEQGGFAFPLLADEDLAVGTRYEILGPLGFYRRSVFVVSPEGRICYAHRSTAGLSFRPTSEIVAAVTGCG